MRAVNLDELLLVMIDRARDLRQAGRIKEAHALEEFGSELEEEYPECRLARCPKCRWKLSMPWEEGKK